MTALGGLASPDVPHAGTVVVALGSVEQHGPHLPVDTDGRVAAWLAEQLTARRPQLLLAPAVPYGASGEHEAAPGTVSIGAAALHHLLVELGRSVSRWADRLLVVNGHGGNLGALTAAVAQLRAEQRDVAWWTPHLDGADAHAGRTETSLLLHLAPHLVHRDRIEIGDTRPLVELLPALQRHGVIGVSPNGVLGDPTRASPADGERWSEELVGQLVAATDAWLPDGHGRLQVPGTASTLTPATATVP